MIDQRWMTQPSNMTHNTTDMTNMNPASIQRPCNNCPRPGMKKLHKAAITLPAEPRPISFSCLCDSLSMVYAVFVPAEAGEQKWGTESVIYKPLGRFPVFGLKALLSDNSWSRVFDWQNYGEFHQMKKYAFKTPN